MPTNAKSRRASAGPRTKSEADYIALLKILRAHFSEDHIDVVLALIPMARNVSEQRTRLTASAYRKGLLAGLSYDSMDEKYPECPYDAKHLANWAHGANDPRTAWRAGSRDALRIRDIILRPKRGIVPELQHREYKALPITLQLAHDERISSLAAIRDAIET